tara:strand:+ start:1768 stop:2115 length:348 start_codon:yes stop_codon:yes gene_type:complete
MSESLIAFIEGKMESLKGLLDSPGLTKSDRTGIERDLVRLGKDYSNLLSNFSQKGMNKGGVATVGKQAKALKTKVMDLEKKIKAKIKPVKAAKGTLVAKNYMNPVNIVNNLKDKK